MGEELVSNGNIDFRNDEEIALEQKVIVYRYASCHVVLERDYREVRLRVPYRIEDLFKCCIALALRIFPEVLCYRDLAISSLYPLECDNHCFSLLSVS